MHPPCNFGPVVGFQTYAVFIVSQNFIPEVSTLLKWIENLTRLRKERKKEKRGGRQESFYKVRNKETQERKRQERK